MVQQEVSEKISELMERHQSGDQGNALVQCLELLSISPTDPELRLLYAKFLYSSGCSELAFEQVNSVYNGHKEKESIKQLLKALNPEFSTQETSTSSKGEVEDSTEEKQKDNSVVAETDFDLDDLDLLEDND